MSLKTFFEKLFPFLFDAIEREFDKLPQSEKDALVQSGQFGQIIKTELHNGYDAIVTAASQKIGLDKATVDNLLTSLAAKFKIDVNAPNELVDKLQEQVNKGLDDSAWDALWTTVSGQLAVILGGGAVSWPTLALGLVEFVYNKFVKGKV